MAKKKKSNEGPPPPQPRDLNAEIAAISTAAQKNAESQTNEAVRANNAFQRQSDQSVQNIAANLGEGGTIYEQRWIPGKTTGKGKNKKTTEGRWEKVAIGEAAPNQFTAAARQNLTGAQAGVDQVQSAQTGIGQLREQYAAQGQDPAMQRLNASAAGQLYRPDQVQGAIVADIGSMQVAPDLNASAAERAMMREARGRGLLGQLEQQAGNDLSLGRSLSAEQEREAAQSARAGMAARGFGTGNSALATEMLNRDRFATQREAERRAFASGVLGQATGVRQAANQAYLTRNESNLARQQQANLATFESAQQRAMADAGYSQQANLANQQANQTQEQYNRAFLGQVAGMNFDQNQARTSMLSGLYGQQAGLGQTTASLQQGMAQSQVALDPYQRALGSNMPIATISPSANLIGQAYGQTMNYGSDLYNTNTNMQASIYNSYQNNQAALRGANMQAGATAAASRNNMMGMGIAGGGMAVGMIGAAVII